MPGSAVASGSVDFVLPPLQIARELAHIARHPHLFNRDRVASREPLPGGREQLGKVFALLRSHTRPGPHIGTLWPLLIDPVQTPVLGYLDRGGTMDERGMLFANRCAWAHVVAKAAGALGELADVLLNEKEIAALMGETEPSAILDPLLRHVELARPVGRCGASLPAPPPSTGLPCGRNAPGDPGGFQ